MIVYLATYPRSGNSLLQQVISQGLKQRASSIKAGAIGTKKGVTPAPEPVDGFPAGLIWDERTAISDKDNSRYILPGPLSYFTEERRKAFASETSVFFVKLHELPFDRYFEGEKVIQVIRNPGAVLWSYFRFLVDFSMVGDGDHIFDRPPPTLLGVINGEAAEGDWSEYHRTWAKADVPKLILRYEGLADDPSAEIQKIAAFSGLPVRSTNFGDFEAYAARFPGKDLRGTSEGYEIYYTVNQLHALSERHGELMREYGYEEPSTADAACSQQVERMEQIMATAWTWGRQFDADRKQAVAKIDALNAKLHRRSARQ